MHLLPMAPVFGEITVGPLFKDIFNRAGIFKVEDVGKIDDAHKALESAVDEKRAEASSLPNWYWVRVFSQAIRLLHRIKSKDARHVDPWYFTCALTFSLLDDPVVLPSGHTVERHVIHSCIKTTGTDPFTGMPLVPSQLAPNEHLAAAIDHYIKYHKHYLNSLA